MALHLLQRICNMIEKYVWYCHIKGFAVHSSLGHKICAGFACLTSLEIVVFVMIGLCCSTYFCKRENYTGLLFPFTLLILLHVCVVKTDYGILLQTFSQGNRH